MPTSTAPEHSFLHDVYALLIGSSLIAVGLAMFKSAGIVTSGLSGWAFLLSEVTGYSFGVLLFIISLPFYIFAYRLLGFWFTLRTVVLVTVVSVSVDMIGVMMTINVHHSLMGSLTGGVLCGMGLLSIMRHGMSMGGFGVLGAFLQHKNIIRAGIVMMSADGILVVLSAFVFPWESILFSLASMVSVNLILIVNHKSEWYVSTSYGMG